MAAHMYAQESHKGGGYRLRARQSDGRRPTRLAACARSWPDIHWADRLGGWKREHLHRAHSILPFRRRNLNLHVFAWMGPLAPAGGNGTTSDSGAWLRPYHVALKNGNTFWQLATPRRSGGRASGSPRTIKPPALAQLLAPRRGRFRNGNPSGNYLTAPRCGRRPLSAPPAYIRRFGGQHCSLTRPF